MSKYKKYLKLSSIIFGFGFFSVVTTLLALNLLIGNKKIDRQLTSMAPVGSQSFERTMSQVLEPPLLEGNSAQALVNGEQIFPAMLSAIRSAQKTITLETYIYWSGDIGQQFARALEERARQGVKVSILIDWYGSEINGHFLEQMRDGGVVIHRYNPPTWTSLNNVNHRTHRRLLVVDGLVALSVALA